MRTPTVRLLASRRGLIGVLFGVALGIGVVPALADDPNPVVPDLSGWEPGGGIGIDAKAGRLVATWNTGTMGQARLVLDLRPGHPLIETLEAGKPGTIGRLPLDGGDPVVILTVGERRQPPNRPPGMSVFNTFFDNPARRPHEVHAGKLDLRSASVTGSGTRATIRLGELEAGPFRGAWEITLFDGSPLLQFEAVMRTDRDRVAFLYDAGVVSEDFRTAHFEWSEVARGLFDGELGPDTKEAYPIPVRWRWAAAWMDFEGPSLVVSPPPHQYFAPSDLSDNIKTCWIGRPEPLVAGPPGFGIRQDPVGAGPYVPWFNAPPGTDQRMGMFLLIAPPSADGGPLSMNSYTRGDQFKPLPGRIRFTSHYHMALTVDAMARARAGAASGPEDGPIPDCIPMFRRLGVDAVHLGEFHGDGHQYDDGPLRLPELKAMFDECRRLSGPDLLFLPGEEVARFLGPDLTNREQGHWMSLFPGPIYWILGRRPDEPFREEVEGYGTVYRVGDGEDVRELLEREHGLVWTAHPRVKSSNWAPDHYRGLPFFNSPTFLGAAWKAMPIDLSRPRLGERALDLLDDMANWGARKQVLGEVDVFKLAKSHELYGPMNINYLEVDHLPGFDDDWSPILDALRGGRFFTTTGEVLIPRFHVGGVPSGGVLKIEPDAPPELIADLQWTYPLQFAEIISGDGTRVYRERIDLSETPAFGARTVRLSPDLTGRTWVRFEVWDVAANGAFTQPIWIEPHDRKTSETP